eukprot:3891808-Pyramimonas_sp.AAC.1
MAAPPAAPDAAAAAASPGILSWGAGWARGGRGRGRGRSARWSRRLQNCSGKMAADVGKELLFVVVRIPAYSASL